MTETSAPTIASPASKLPRSAGRWRIALATWLVIACGLLLGWFAHRTWNDPLPPEYPLEWGAARWIEPATDSPNGYFRKSIWLDEAPRRAWLQIAGSDNIEVYLNGKLVGQSIFYSMATSAFYDLTSALQPGKNVLAVSVARLSFPGRAGLIAHLGIEDSKPLEREFISDSTWKAEDVPKGIVNGLPWRALVLDDSLWPAAVVTGPPQLPVQRVPVQPAIFRAPLGGFWLASANQAEKEIRFRTELDVPAGSDTWIEIGAMGDYELSINGRLVCDRSSSNGVLDLLSLRRWLHPGVNRLSFRVRALLTPPALFAQGLTVGAEGQVTTFSTNESWKMLDREGEPERSATVAGRYGDQPWGYWEKKAALLSPMPGEEVRTGLRGAAILLLTTGLVWLLWRAVGIAFGQEALLSDALAHLPAITAILLLLLLSMDMRQSNDCSFRPAIFTILCALLLVSKGLLAAARLLWPRVQPALRRPRLSRLIPATLILVITAAGVVPRVAHLTDISLDHDEMSLIQMAKAIPHSGYPHAMIGSQNRNLTTYEATTYPIALSGVLTGWSETGVRLPAVVFGALTVAAIGFWAWRWFGPSAGVLASLIFAFLPSAMEWSRNCFWPQQAQFWALMTVGFFYEGASGPALKHRQIDLACAGIALTYLSWEGAGFLLPALCLAFIALRWPDFSWVKDLRLWAAFLIVSAIIVSQLSYRQINMQSYMMVGPGLSDLKSPSLFFLNAMFDPLFYWVNFLHPENHYPFTLLTGLGIVLFWRQRALLYLVTVLALLLISYTAFLSVYAVRYAHWFLPLLILSGVGTAAEIWRRITRFAGSWPEAFIARGCLGLLTAALWDAGSGLGLMGYRLSAAPAVPVFRTRTGIYQFDYRGASRFVRANLEPGDVVIPAFPHVYQYYAGSPGDYFMTTILAKRTMYDPSGEAPRYTDRFGGNPVLRDLGEAQDVLSHGARVWIVSVPAGVFNEFNDPTLPKFLFARGEIVYESYSAQVYLCRGVGRTREGVYDQTTSGIPATAGQGSR